MPQLRETNGSVVQGGREETQNPLVIMRGGREKKVMTASPGKKRNDARVMNRLVACCRLYGQFYQTDEPLQGAVW